MSFKVGDRVRILDTMREDREWFMQGIDRFYGKSAVVKDVAPSGGANWYELDVDSGEFLWREVELEPDFEVGDKVQIVDIPAGWFPEHWNKLSKRYAGKETVVKKKFRLYGGVWYSLEIDGGLLCWKASDLIMLDYQEMQADVSIDEFMRLL